MITQDLFKDWSQWCSYTAVPARAHPRALPGPPAGVTVSDSHCRRDSLLSPSPQEAGPEKA